MLKLTKKIEYALIALQHMQSKNNNEVTSVKEVTEEYDLPASLLAKVLKQLAKNNIIDLNRYHPPSPAFSKLHDIITIIHTGNRLISSKSR